MIFYFNNSVRKKDGSSRGSSILMIIAAINILLILGALAINGAFYYRSKTDLDLLTQNVANYAGTFLPDVQQAYAKAQESFSTLNKDFRSCAADGTGCGQIFPGAALEVTVKYYDASCTASPDCDANQFREVKYDPTAVKVKYPIKSLGISIKAGMPLRLFRYPAADPVQAQKWNEGGGTPLFTLVSKATAELIPTDVVLIVENSNSVISPVGASISNERSIFQGSPFNDPWGTAASYFTAIPSPSTFTNIPKGVAAIRQCYGAIHRDIKTAAVTLYDLFSASANFRVGVIHTLNQSGIFAKPSVNIVADSYIKAFQRQPVQIEQDVDASKVSFITPLGKNSAPGNIDYPETRCAALVSTASSTQSCIGQDCFNLPSYLFEGTSDSTWASQAFVKNFHAMMDSSTSTDPFQKFSFLPSANILPRELLWITDAGVVDPMGRPNPQYDYNFMQLSILRAMDMLNQAPERKDHTAVRRRVILVLADGFERAYEIDPNHTILKGLINDKDFLRAPGFGASPSNLQKLSDMISNNLLTDDYCSKNLPTPSQAETNPIFTYTDPSILDEDPANKNLAGMQLGFLLYTPTRSAIYGTSTTDAFSYLANLKWHDKESIPAECSQAGWSEDRGRFALAAETEDDYINKFAPGAARALFSVQTTMKN